MRHMLCCKEMKPCTGIAMVVTKAWRGCCKNYVCTSREVEKMERSVNLVTKEVDDIKKDLMKMRDEMQ